MDEARARRLLLISCSSRKVKATEPLRAWDLYDGVVYRMLKRAARRCSFRDDTDVVILSALYGILTPDSRVEWYDLKMTRELAERQASSNVARLAEIVRREIYVEVMLAVGKTYARALEPTKKWLPEGATVIRTSGGTGMMLSQIKAWSSSGDKRSRASARYLSRAHARQSSLFPPHS